MKTMRGIVKRVQRRRGRIGRVWRRPQSAAWASRDQEESTTSRRLSQHTEWQRSRSAAPQEVCEKTTSKQSHAEREVEDDAQTTWTYRIGAFISGGVRGRRDLGIALCAAVRNDDTMPVDRFGSGCQEESGRTEGTYHDGCATDGREGNSVCECVS